MRIALLHSYYASTAPSGENTAVELQADALRRYGHDVAIFGVRTDDLSGQRLYPLRTACSVALHGGKDPSPWLRSWRPDVVHVHNLFPNVSQRWLAAWSGPLVATVHNYRPLCAAGTLERDGKFCDQCPSSGTPFPALRYGCYRQSRLATLPMALAQRPIRRNPLLSRADRIIFLSPRARDIYLNVGFQREPHATIIPNFVAPIPHSSPSREFSWVYIGRLSPEKGIIPLLRAWPPGLPLTIIGSGPQEEEVRRLAGGTIEYRGALARDQLLKELPTYKGLVFPSLFSEGLPTVYLESLAAGLPVVARAGNSAADDVQAHGTGIVFEETADLAAALDHLEREYFAYALRARARHRERFSQDAWLADANSLYHDITR